MKCAYHSKSNAVTICKKCNRFICDKCILEYDKIYCPKCAIKVLNEAITYQKKWLSKYRFKVIVGFILFIISLIYLPKLKILSIWAFSIPLGFFAVYNSKQDPYVPTTLEDSNKLFTWNLIVSVILSPIVAIFSVFEYIKVKKYLEDISEEYNRLNSM